MRSILLNSHSLLHRGQTDRALSQRWGKEGGREGRREGERAMSLLLLLQKGKRGKEERGEERGEREGGREGGEGRLCSYLNAVEVENVGAAAEGDGKAVLVVRGGISLAGWRKGGRNGGRNGGRGRVSSSRRRDNTLSLLGDGLV